MELKASDMQRELKWNSEVGWSSFFSKKMTSRKHDVHWFLQNKHLILHCCVCFCAPQTPLQANKKVLSQNCIDNVEADWLQTGSQFFCSQAWKSTHIIQKLKPTLDMWCGQTVHCLHSNQDVMCEQLNRSYVCKQKQTDVWTRWNVSNVSSVLNCWFHLKFKQPANPLKPHSTERRETSVASIFGMKDDLFQHVPVSMPTPIMLFKKATTATETLLENPVFFHLLQDAEQTRCKQRK